MTYTDADFVRKYIELRDRKKQIEDRLKDELAPINDAMDKLEGFLLDRLNQSGAESIKTEYGTAYKSKVMSAKVADRESLMRYVREHQAFHLLTANVAKDAVREYMESSDGNPPPGVDVTFITNINFRRPS